MAAIAVVLAVFFAIGYGVVSFRHQFPIPEFLSTEDAAPAPDHRGERAPRAP